MDKSFRKSKQYSILEDIWSLCLTVAVFTYLAIGFFVKIWHPTWIIFVVAFLVALIFTMLLRKTYHKNQILSEDILEFNKQFELSQTYAKTVKVSGILFVLTIVCYVVTCSIIGLWHPLWLMFLLMAVIEQSVAIVFKAKFKDCNCTNIDNENYNK